MKDLTNEQLIELYHKKARSMSFYNAAEGSCWYQEADARAECSKQLKETLAELKERGIETPKGDYLV